MEASARRDPKVYSACTSAGCEAIREMEKRRTTAELWRERNAFMFAGAKSTGKNTPRDRELPGIVTQNSELKVEDKLKQTTTG